MVLQLTGKGEMENRVILDKTRGGQSVKHTDVIKRITNNITKTFKVDINPKNVILALHALLIDYSIKLQN